MRVINFFGSGEYNIDSTKYSYKYAMSSIVKLNFCIFFLQLEETNIK
jgi:hypothetical protein